MNHSTYAQNRQQALLLGGAMFGSIVAAVLVSTFIIMSLMRGEMASALSSVQPAAVTPASASTCVSPADTQGDMGMGSGAVSTAEGSADHGTGVWGHAHAATWAKPVAPVAKVAAPAPSNVHNSYNTTNNSTANNTTTSNITGSYNGIGNGNTDNSVNTVNTNINSGNTLTDNSVNTDNSQTNSNNDVDVLSNNDILSNNDLLSDNVVLPVTPVVVLP